MIVRGICMIESMEAIGLVSLHGETVQEISCLNSLACFFFDSFAFEVLTCYSYSSQAEQDAIQYLCRELENYGLLLCERSLISQFLHNVATFISLLVKNIALFFPDPVLLACYYILPPFQNRWPNFILTLNR